MTDEESKKTTHCPSCDSEQIEPRYLGASISEKEKQEMMCLGCAKLFEHKDIIIKEWRLIE